MNEYIFLDSFVLTQRKLNVDVFENTAATYKCTNIGHVMNVGHVKRKTFNSKIWNNITLGNPLYRHLKISGNFGAFSWMVMFFFITFVMNCCS